MLYKITKEQLNELAKEACWEDGSAANCKGNCAKCSEGHWKHWKHVVEAIVKGFVRMNND